MGGKTPHSAREGRSERINGGALNQEDRDMEYRREFMRLLEINQKIKDLAIELKKEGRRPITTGKRITELTIEAYEEMDRLTTLPLGEHNL